MLVPGNIVPASFDILVNEDGEDDDLPLASEGDNRDDDYFVMTFW